MNHPPQTTETLNKGLQNGANEPAEGQAVCAFQSVGDWTMWSLENN